MDGGTWQATVHGVSKQRHHLHITDQLSLSPFQPVCVLGSVLTLTPVSSSGSTHNRNEDVTSPVVGGFLGTDENGSLCGKTRKHVAWWFAHLSVLGSVAQSCPALCDLMDCSLPGSSVHGVLQARALEWVAIPFSRGSS